MEYLFSILLFIISTILAYLMVKRNYTFWTSIALDLLLLSLGGVAMIITEFKETPFLIYNLLCFFTLLGKITRLVAPLFLNAIRRILSKLQKEKYEVKSYNELMQSGHRMFFCVLSFTTLKNALYFLLILSCLGLI